MSTYFKSRRDSRTKTRREFTARGLEFSDWCQPILNPREIPGPRPEENLLLNKKMLRLLDAL
jgi:hypothetical protein